MKNLKLKLGPFPGTAEKETQPFFQCFFSRFCSSFFCHHHLLVHSYILWAHFSALIPVLILWVFRLGGVKPCCGVWWGQSEEGKAESQQQEAGSQSVPSGRGR